jgi:hypothetical protein
LAGEQGNGPKINVRVTVSDLAVDQKAEPDQL